MNQIYLTVDLGFGDAGKGGVVDFLTRETGAHTVVRYNGGAQAGHRVVTAGRGPQEHVFAQFGAGTLAGAATHLSRFMLLDPLGMEAEAAHLAQLGVPDPYASTTIDGGALVITPFQRSINRLRELARGAARHGSCGMGIGETALDALNHGAQTLRAADLAHPARLRAKLAFVREVNLAKLRELTLPDTAAVAAERALLEEPDWDEWLVEAFHALACRARIVDGDYLHGLLRRRGTVIFEGAQGVLLDEWHGFHPHTTWSTTTLANADQLLCEAGYHGRQTRIGITRAYATRHGSGPLVTEDAALTHALPDARNRMHDWQQGFRVGWLDLVLLRYAREVVGPLDTLAVTCLDRLKDVPELRLCTGYRHPGCTLERLPRAATPHNLAHQERLTGLLEASQPLLKAVASPDALLHAVSHALDLPIGLVSYGPDAAAKRLVDT